ncbi:MAG: hypothetical protein WC459_00155 [Patescibacteria group bacterium]
MLKIKKTVKRILLLDIPDITSLLRIIINLEMPEVEVHETSDPKKALDGLRKKEFNALIMEPLLPSHGGLMEELNHEAFSGPDFLEAVQRIGACPECFIGIITTGAYDKTHRISEKVQKIAGQNSKVYVKPYNVRGLISDIKKALKL